MRFQHLLMSLPGLRGADADTKYEMHWRAIKAKWLLWHGQQARCLERLESLRRDTGWAGARNPLGRLIRYLRGCSRYLVNYRQRRAQGLPISSAGAESVVDYVIGQRMKRNGHMRWPRRPALFDSHLRGHTHDALEVQHVRMSGDCFSGFIHIGSLCRTDAWPR